MSNKLPKKSLVSFQTVAIYGFVPGIFHSLLLFMLFLTLAYWGQAYVSELFTFCRCGPMPEFLFWSDLFPKEIVASVLLTWLVLYIVSCLFETAIYVYKSTLTLGVHQGLLTLPTWFVRVLIKNAAGLCLILAAMAQPEYVSSYLLAALSFSFFIYWSHRGQYQGFQLGLDPGQSWPGIPRDAKLIFYFFALFYVLVLILSGDAPVLIILGLILMVPAYFPTSILLISSLLVFWWVWRTYLKKK